MAKLKRRMSAYMRGITAEQSRHRKTRLARGEAGWANTGECLYARGRWCEQAAGHAGARLSQRESAWDPERFASARQGLFGSGSEASDTHCSGEFWPSLPKW